MRKSKRGDGGRQSSVIRKTIKRKEKKRKLGDAEKRV